MYGPNIGFGIQRLIDAQMRYVRNSHTVSLRVRNFPDKQLSSQAIQMGFSISPSGTANVGTTDIPIDPPPSVKMMSMSDVGRSMGMLRFGDRQFIVSASFVDNQVKQQGLSNQDLVWRGSNVLGLVTDNQLFAIIDIAHEEYGGKTVIWTLMARAPETTQPGTA